MVRTRNPAARSASRGVQSAGAWTSVSDRRGSARDVPASDSAALTERAYACPRDPATRMLPVKLSASETEERTPGGEPPHRETGAGTPGGGPPRRETPAGCRGVAPRHREATEGSPPRAAPHHGSTQALPAEGAPSADGDGRQASRETYSIGNRCTRSREDTQAYGSYARPPSADVVIIEPRRRWYLETRCHPDPDALGTALDLPGAPIDAHAPRSGPHPGTTAGSRGRCLRGPLSSLTPVRALDNRAMWSYARGSGSIGTCS